jgi:hypothetical protein
MAWLVITAGLPKVELVLAIGWAKLTLAPRARIGLRSHLTAPPIDTNMKPPSRFWRVGLAGGDAS